MHPNQFPLSLGQGKGAAIPNRMAICAKLQHIADELSCFKEVLRQYQYVPYSKTLFDANEHCQHRIEALKKDVQILQKRYTALQSVFSSCESQATSVRDSQRRMTAALFSEALQCEREAKILKKAVRQYTDEIDAHRMSPQTI